MEKEYNGYLEKAYLGIAHRGLHNSEFTENGLKAFKNAIDHDLTFELDIHLTKDNELIVCHDSELERTTGKKGIIEQLTLKEIKENYRLLDGEEVPTFQEVLDLNKEKEIIVTELKTYEGNWKQLAKKARETLSQIKDPNKIIMISFDPRALKKMGRRYQRQLLVCKEHYWVWKLRRFFDSVDIDSALIKREEVQKYRRSGHIVNVWTIENAEMLKEISSYADMITFQLFDPAIVIEDRKKYLSQLKK